MADIDEELLALAGEASSDEEEDAPMNISRESSASAEGGGRGATSRGRKATSRKRTRRGNKDDSEEEGEASSDHSSPNSLRSAPMDESDSDSDTAPAAIYDDEDRYPLEGKFINAADKAEILAMPEIKREELLAERAQQVERDRQNRALRQLLNAREIGNKKLEKKRKAATADLEDTQRKTSRQRTKVGGGRVGESRSGIDSLKRARAEKDDRQRRRQEDRERHGDRLNQVYSSDIDADGESDLEWADGKAKARASLSPEVRDAQPAELRDIERIRVGRSRFAQVCFYPGFDEAITGCFTRISIGVDQTTGQNIYRMAVIKGFTEGKPYGMQQANGKNFVTTQYLRAAHGKAEKEWPFITCSDSPFTEAEWNRYKQTCLAEGVVLPTKPKSIKKIEDINALVNRTWTEAELQAKLRKSGVLTNKYIPIERNRLLSLLKEAKAANDEESVELIKEKLEKLEGPKLAFGTSLHSGPKKPKPKTESEQDKLARLNQENRRKNAEEVRQALIKERRALLAAEAAIARGEAVVEDHSRRVKTRAKFKHDVNDLGKDTSRSGTHTPATSTPTISAQKDNAPLPHIAQLQQANVDKNGLPTIHRPLFDDDIIGSIDLGLEIDI